MSEEKVLVEQEEVIDKKALKAKEKAEKLAAKKAKREEAGEKPHRVLDFLSKEYKGENIVMLVLALFAIVLGALIVNGTLKIDEEKFFLIGYLEGKLFAWILIGLAVISLAFVVIPFFRPSFSEIKHLKGLSKVDFLLNVARTFVFILLMCVFFFLCDLGLNPLMELIKA